ncbi:hypothetical protein, partial [Teredinibacter waterburyi]|uniref:hypothetical protein n=1 Tax=Teredinibacter waterburyi TaxID=1500538 RepID=UPI001CAA87DE
RSSILHKRSQQKLQVSLALCLGVRLNKYVLLFSLLLAGCGGDEEEPSGNHEISGRWKTGCFTDDPVDYWVTTEYVFNENHAQQVVNIYEDENCTVGIGNANGGPSISEGEYFFLKSVVTADGLSADIYGQYFLSRDPAEISELGVFVDNDTLYLVFRRSDSYIVNFERPFFNNDE